MASNEDIILRTLGGLNILPLPLTLETVKLENPTPGTPPGLTETTINTKFTVVGTGECNARGESYIGDVDVFYTRIDVGVLLEGLTLDWEAGDVTSTQDFSDWALEHLGLEIGKGYIVDKPITENDTGLFITIELTGDHPLYFGSVTVRYLALTTRLSDLIPVDTRIDTTYPLEKQSMRKQMSYPFRWNSLETLLADVYSKQHTPVRDESQYQKISNTIVGDYEYIFKNNSDILRYEGVEIVGQGGRVNTRVLYLLGDDYWLHME